MRDILIISYCFCFAKQLTDGLTPVVGQIEPPAMTVPTVHAILIDTAHMTGTLKLDHARPQSLRSIVILRQNRHTFDFLMGKRTLGHPKNQQHMNLLSAKHHATAGSAEWRRNAATPAAVIHPATHLTPNRTPLILAAIAHTGSDTHGLRHQPQ